MIKLYVVALNLVYNVTVNIERSQGYRVYYCNFDLISIKRKYLELYLGEPSYVIMP